MIINRKLITLYIPSILLVGALLTSCNKSDTPTPSAPTTQTGGSTGDGSSSDGGGGTSNDGSGTTPGDTGGSGTGGSSGGTSGGSGGTSGGSGGTSGGSGSGGSTPTPTPTPTPGITADEQKMLTLVNNVRATGCNCGGQQMPAVPALTWSPQLKVAAQGHSDWMLANNTMSHTGANGSTASDRVTAAGYQWRAVGENVAMGFSNVDAVMQGWLGSAGHCKNIMSANYKEFGSAVAGKFWTQNFATKK